MAGVLCIISFNFGHLSTVFSPPPSIDRIWAPQSVEAFLLPLWCCLKPLECLYHPDTFNLGPLGSILSIYHKNSRENGELNRLFGRFGGSAHCAPPLLYRLSSSSFDTADPFYYQQEPPFRYKLLHLRRAAHRRRAPRSPHGRHGTARPAHVCCYLLPSN